MITLGSIIEPYISSRTHSLKNHISHQEPILLFTPSIFEDLFIPYLPSFQRGQTWLWDELGVRSEYSWSIDPFGLSGTMAHLLGLSGLRGLVVQRLHYSWKRWLSERGSVDLSWTVHSSSSPGLRLRTQPTHGYSVSDSCGPVLSLCQEFDFNPDISTAEGVNFQNVHAKSELLLGLYGRLGSLSASNVALHTLGGDFRFENTSEWLEQYRNYKAIFDYLNGNRNIYKADLSFGTLKTFFNSVFDFNATVQGDFFPYADLNSDNTLGYWTGYFSTRPFYKKLSRNLECSLRSADILYTLSLNGFRQAGSNQEATTLARLYPRLVRARRASALFLHHDGITGTSKLKVMKDYKNKLLKASIELKTVISTCIELLFYQNKPNTTIENQYIQQFVIFNSLPYYRSEIVSLKVETPSISLKDPSGKSLLHQINIIYDKNFTASCKTYELLFHYTFPPVSLSAFEITKITKDFRVENYMHKSTNSIEKIIIANDQQKLTFDENGLISSICKDFGSVKLKVNLKTYKALNGKSGAYLFRPLPNSKQYYSDSADGSVIFKDGLLTKEVIAQYWDNFTISSKLYKVKSYLNEIIEIKVTYNLTKFNTELVIEFNSNMRNTKFFSDANCFEIRERLRILDLPIEANYFPMTCIGYLENSEFRLALLSDHSHGTASLSDGSLEIMLDRRIFEDDNRGLEEGLMDNVKMTSTFYLVYQKNKSESKELLSLYSLLLNNPSYIVLLTNDTRRTFMQMFPKPLPEHIHLLTLRTLTDGVLPSSRALMVLQNFSTCRNSTFPPESTLSNLTFRNIIRTSLTGVIEYEEISDLSELTVQPNEIQSFKLFC